MNIRNIPAGKKIQIISTTGFCGAGDSCKNICMNKQFITLPGEKVKCLKCNHEYDYSSFYTISVSIVDKFEKLKQLIRDAE